jgi:hypothetical protein
MSTTENGATVVRWSTDATDFGDSVAGSLQRAGGTELARRCESAPHLRTEVVAPVLEALGLADLRADEGADELQAAARAALAAGAVLCPWPLVSTLALTETAAEYGDAVLLGGPEAHRLEHLDLAARPLAVDPRTGALRRVFATGGIDRAPLDPFSVACTIDDETLAIDQPAAVLSVVLRAFWIVGSLGTVARLTAEHAATRRQFGRPIVEFGGVQWHLSEVALAHDGLAELAAYTLHLHSVGRATPADVAALHVTGLKASRDALAHGHQVLAAVGLCEEHDLTLVDRHLQAWLRRPLSLAAATAWLAQQIRAHGFDAIFPVPASAPAQVGHR